MTNAFKGVLMWESKTCVRKESTVVISISSLRCNVLEEVPSRPNATLCPSKKKKKNPDCGHVTAESDLFPLTFVLADSATLIIDWSLDRSCVCCKNPLAGWFIRCNTSFFPSCSCAHTLGCCVKIGGL